MDLMIITKTYEVIFYRDVRCFKYSKKEIDFKYGNVSDGFNSVSWNLSELKAFRVINDKETKANLRGKADE